MLNHLTIKDFAIIDSVSLDFYQGFHIFTGETGAGKSILIEAISLALGARADSTCVRTGKEKAVIELSAATRDPEIRVMLSENGIVQDESASGETVLEISREIQAEGRNTCRINGTLVSVAFLAKLCKRLADIHGQYDHQSLLDSEQHIRLLDAFGGAALNSLKKTVAADYHEYAKAKQKLDSLLKNRAESERKRDFMRFEADEIAAAAIRPGEDTELTERLSVIQHSELIFQRLSAAYELLYEETEGFSACDALSRSSRLLVEAGDFSQEIRTFSAELSDCYYRLESLQSEIRIAKENVSFSQDDLDATVERLDLIEKLKKKYGGTIEQVLAYYGEICESLSVIENADDLIKSLRKDCEARVAALDCSNAALTEIRKSVAVALEHRIAEELEALHFKDARLFVRFEDTPADKKTVYTEEGIDRLEFLLITNKGETPKPLVKIASGGEISRIMLAFKTVIGDFAGIPTMIFDEIDSGISGVTASVVGRKLKQLSQKHQVICITHLPQIAAFSDHHYRIAKEDNGERTESRVHALGPDEKIAEIARLLGGMDVTETTVRNAMELISATAKQ